MKKHKVFTNSDIAELLGMVAAAYEVLNENRFKIAAYQQAAVSVEHATSETKDLWDDGKLETIPGIGKNIASYLDELFRTGRVKHFEELFRKVPSSMFEFIKIPGVGPKTAYVLARKLKINEAKGAIERLRTSAKEGKVRQLENFGEKKEEDLLEGINSLKKGEIKTKRMLLPHAFFLAEEIINYLKTSPVVIEAKPLGSLRRMVATVGDIDIAVSTLKPKEVLAHFFKFPKIKRILSKGEEDLGRIILETGQQIDVRTCRPDNFGSMLQYFTGSKQHNIALREYALSKGLSLSEYGIKQVKSLPAGREEKVQSFSNEEEFYQALGLAWIPPELRENAGEIQAALNGKLPKLVELKDIKGDLHIHSDFPIEGSHDIGESSWEEMIQMAEDLGYQYLGFSEHSPSTSQHSEKGIIDLIKKKKEYFEEIKCSYKAFVKKRGNKLPIIILNGLEIDIRPDGSLALPPKALDLLDYAIASIHTSMQMNKEEMTKRVIEGLSHSKVKILGHPTGRMLNKREGYELNWEKLFDFCLKNGKILEISAMPDRLDLPDVLVREVVKLGLKLIIDSDAHSAETMKLMKFGVAVTRRGWAEKKDIINCLSFEKLSDILLST